LLVRQVSEENEAEDEVVVKAIRMDHLVVGLVEELLQES
jgi:hypothetical protein